MAGIITLGRLLAVAIGNGFAVYEMDGGHELVRIDAGHRAPVTALLSLGKRPHRFRFAPGAPW